MKIKNVALAIAAAGLLLSSQSVLAAVILALMLPWIQALARRAQAA